MSSKEQKQEILKSKFQKAPDGEYNPIHEAMSEYAKQEAIAFLDSIRDYIRESHNDLINDDRTSEQLYELYKSTHHDNTKNTLQ